MKFSALSVCLAVPLHSSDNMASETPPHRRPLRSHAHQPGRVARLLRSPHCWGPAHGPRKSSCRGEEHLISRALGSHRLERAWVSLLISASLVGAVIKPPRTPPGGPLGDTSPPPGLAASFLSLSRLSSPTQLFGGISDGPIFPGTLKFPLGLLQEG